MNAVVKATFIVFLLSSSLIFANKDIKTLGCNIGGFAYYGTQIPLKNVSILSAAGWQYILWGGPGGIMPPTDADGYPLSIPDSVIANGTKYKCYGCKLWTFLHSPGVEPAGDYVLLYDGEGDFKFAWDASNAVKTSEGRYTFKVTPHAGSAIEIDMIRTNPNNHIHNVRIMEARFEGNYMDDPWYPELEQLYAQDFGVIRFMGWTVDQGYAKLKDGCSCWGPGQPNGTEWQPVSLNSIKLPSYASSEDGAYVGCLLGAGGINGYRIITAYDGANRIATFSRPCDTLPPVQTNNFWTMEKVSVDWNERIKAPDPRSFEMIVDLSNRTCCSPWISIPPGATDNFVKQLAIYLRDNLDPDLKAYIEYGNEDWNFGYLGYRWCNAKAGELGISDWAYCPYRVVQICKIFDDIFGEPHLRAERKTSRLVRVIATHAGWTEWGQAWVSWDGWNQIKGTVPNPLDPGKRTCDYVDVMAVTNYLHGNLSYDQVCDLSIDQMAAKINTEIDAQWATPKPMNDIGSAERVVMGTDTFANIWSTQLQIARKYGLNLVTYEASVDLPGTHWMPDSNSNPQWTSARRQLYIDKAYQFHLSKQLKDVYVHLLNAWKEQGLDTNGNGTTLWNHFYDTSWERDATNQGEWGHWAIRYTMQQPIDSCPRWQALREYGHANPAKWWTEPALPLSKPAIFPSGKPKVYYNALDTIELNFPLTSSCGIDSGSMYYHYQGGNWLKYGGTNMPRLDHSDTITAYATAPGYLPIDTLREIYTFKVATPIVTPDSGAYNFISSIAMACTTDNAKLYYTFDGTPFSTTTWTLYTDSTKPSLDHNATMRVIGVRPGFLNSDIKTVVYWVSLLDAARPSALPAGTIYHDTLSVKLKCNTANAQIYYTTDNSAFSTTTWTLYDTAHPMIAIKASDTLRAVAVHTGLKNSMEMREGYILKVPKPVVTPDSGKYDRFIDSISISCSLPSTSINYRFGTSGAWHVYNPDSLPSTSSTATLYAFASRAGFQNSETLSVRYTVSLTRITSGAYFDINGDGAIDKAVVHLDRTVRVFPSSITFTNPFDKSKVTLGPEVMINGPDSASITVTFPSPFSYTGNTGFTSGPFGSTNAAGFQSEPFVMDDSIGPLLTDAAYYPHKDGSMEPDTLKLTLSENFDMTGFSPAMMFRYIPYVDTQDAAIFNELTDSTFVKTGSKTCYVLLPNWPPVSPGIDHLQLLGGMQSYLTDAHGVFPNPLNKPVLIRWGAEFSLQWNVGPNPFIPGVSPLPASISKYFDPNLKGIGVEVVSIQPINEGDYTIFDKIGNVTANGALVVNGTHRAYCAWDGRNKNGRFVGRNTYLMAIRAINKQSTTTARIKIGVTSKE